MKKAKKVTKEIKNKEGNIQEIKIKLFCGKCNKLLGEVSNSLPDFNTPTNSLSGKLLVCCPDCGNLTKLEFNL